MQKGAFKGFHLKKAKLQKIAASVVGGGRVGETARRSRSDVKSTRRTLEHMRMVVRRDISNLKRNLLLGGASREEFIIYIVKTILKNDPKKMDTIILRLLSESARKARRQKLILRSRTSRAIVKVSLSGAARRR